MLGGLTRRSRPVAIAVLAWLATSLGSQEPSFRFGAAGDFGHDDRFRDVAALVAAVTPDFFIALGDLSYDRREQAWCNTWTRDVGYRNILVIAGNHDSGESRGGNIHRYIEHCGNPFGIGPGYGTRYAFEYPPTQPLARFILVTPGVTGRYLAPGSHNYDRGTENYRFVSDAIDHARELRIPWIIVVMHENYVSVLEKENTVSTDPGRSFMTMLLEKRVDLILQGHEHGYERTHQLATNPATCPLMPTDAANPNCIVDRDGAFARGAGTVIQVIGTGGRDFRGIDRKDPEWPYFAVAENRTWGFGEFTVTPSRVMFAFRRSSGGDLKDAFTISGQ